MRADNIRGLSAAGWRSALDHGIRRAVDLRFPSEQRDEAEPPKGVNVIAVSLFGEYDPIAEGKVAERLLDMNDVAAAHAGFYIRTLEQRPETVAAAVGAVASGDDADGVVIHCFAGKDRTGIVSALVLSVAGVPDEVIASDYAESAPNMVHLFDGWIADAGDDQERELRRRLAAAEHETMLDVLAWLHDAGGSRAYLIEAGLTSEKVDRLERRLVGTGTQDAGPATG